MSLATFYYSDQYKKYYWEQNTGVRESYTNLPAEDLA